MKYIAIALFLIGCAAHLIAGQPPTIGPISDHEVLQDQPTDAIPLALTDLDTPVLGLRLTGSSSNPKLVPTGNIFFGSAFGRWYTSVTPAFGEVGDATITITVSDGQLSTNTSFHLTVHAPPNGWRRFVDSSTIAIPDLGKATPYPVQMNITDAPGTITNVILTISKFSHQNIHDVNMLLVGPTGQGVIIFSHISGPRSVSNVTVYLTDRSAFPLPQNFDLWSEPLRPTAYSPVPSFPTPAPAGPYGPVALSTFNGLPANGTWSLYITDDTSTNHGSITGGWSLMIATTTNLAPTISDIPNQSVFPGGSTPSLPFSIDDADTPIENLTLSTSSSDASLVPPENILIEGTGAAHTIRVTPAGGQTGSATVTVTVSDGLNSASDSFVLTVGSTNSAPNIGQISNRTTLVDTPVGPFSIFVSDPETPVGSLSITGTSSNPRLVPNANIICFNAGVQTVTLIPIRGQMGTATITIFASDGIASPSKSFVLTVNPPGFGTDVFENASFITIEDAGTAALYPSSIEIVGVPGAIKQLAVTLRGLSHTLPDDLDILLVGPSGEGVVLFSDAGGITPVNDLNLTLSDRAEFALPDEFRLLPGTYRPADFFGSDGPAAFPLPAPAGPYAATLASGFSGESPNGIWSLYIMDDTAGNSGALVGGWSLEITTESAPSISDIPDQFVMVNGTNGPVPFTVDDAETDPFNLTITVGSSNTELVPTSNIVIGGVSSNRTFTITPAADQLGTTTVTISVDDGELTSSKSFLLTVSTLPVLTVTVNDTNRLYGAANPEFTATITGLLPGDEIIPGFSTTAAPPSPIGTYPILLTLTDPENRLGGYLVVTNDGELSILKAPLLVVADKATRDYGSSNSVLTGVITGLRSGDSITATYLTSAEASSPIGEYEIVPLLNDPAAELSNYVPVLQNGTLTVAPAILTCTIADTNRLYGAVNPVFSAAYTGFKNADGVESLEGELYTLTAAQPDSPPGFYPVTAFGQTASNYLIVYLDGTLTIQPAPLQIIVDNQTRLYGEVNPLFTGSIIGIQNGDNLTSDYTSVAVPASPVGAYQISANLVDPENRLGNYTLNVTVGTLMVTVSPLTVRADDAARHYGAPNPAFSGEIVGIKNSDLIIASYTSSATLNSPVGSYEIVPSLIDVDQRLDNYQVALSAGTLSVLPTIAPSLNVLQTFPFSMIGSGDAGVIYTIEASSDLEDWQEIGTIAADSDGAFLFEDDTSIDSPYRFYRALIP